MERLERWAAVLIGEGGHGLPGPAMSLVHPVLAGGLVLVTRWRVRRAVEHRNQPPGGRRENGPFLLSSVFTYGGGDLMSQRTVWDSSPGGRGAVSLLGIWGAVVAISLFAPDLVSGSEHEHLPIAAFTTWIWGAIASRRIITTLLRLDEAGSETQLGGPLAALVGGVWAVAAAVAIFAPPMVTGSDPTRLPIAAMLAPIAATALTTGACEMASVLAAQRHRRPFPTPDYPTHP